MLEEEEKEKKMNHIANIKKASRNTRRLVRNMRHRKKKEMQKHILDNSDSELSDNEKLNRSTNVILQNNKTEKIEDPKLYPDILGSNAPEYKEEGEQ